MSDATLYLDPLSPGSQMALFAVHEAGVDIKQQKISSGPSQRNLHPDFFALAKSGRLPLLVHNGELVKGGFAICKYMNRQMPGVNLIPKGDWQQSLCHEWLVLAEQLPVEGYFLTHAGGRAARNFRNCIKAGIRKCRRQQKRKTELAEGYQSWQSGLERQLGLAALSPDAPQVIDINAAVNTALNRLDSHLADKEWIAEQFSLADIAWGALLARLSVATKAQLWSDNSRPHLNRYVERLKQRKGYRNAGLGKQPVSSLRQVFRFPWLLAAVIVIALLLVVFMPLSVGGH